MKSSVLIAAAILIPGSIGIVSAEGCGVANCLAPSQTQVDTLFGRIEQRYPTLFPASAPTQYLALGNEPAYYRRYAAEVSGLATYQGSIWYATGGSWYRYASLDTANAEFCSGTCWGSRRFKAEVWADNWFSLYVGENKVGEDSVPITTTRSFNAETIYFDAGYPLTLNVVIRDYIQNDTGLEYIGTPQQQIGDGGFIMQVTDTTSGKVVAVSNAAMKCLVIQKAPLNPSCEKDPNPTQTCRYRSDTEPAGWKGGGFDTSAWENATIYSEAQVGPKDGYYSIAWNPAAKLIWTSDLKLDNTLLCTVTVTAAP